MPLITSNTDLKSLSFGHDRPGGGSSGQPFIFTGFNIPEVEFSHNQTLTDAYSASAGAGAGQNFFDIPPFTFDAPTFGYAPGNSTVKTTLFNGNGIDIATPILNGLDGIASGIVNGAEGAINAVIGTINNSFDTTRNPSSPDFLWRKNRYNIAHSFADAVRITKFLTTPAGIFFIIKQELLERQNVKVDGYTRLYNPASTIAQAGVNSIGYHLNKAGLNPFERSYFKGGNSGYFDNAAKYKDRIGFINQPDTIGRGSNRLTILTLSKINQESTSLTILGHISNQYGVNGPNSEDLLTYGGGPGSILGIGNTNIRWQNKTRTVLLRREKTGFAQADNINNPNYLTPLGQPTIAWYYNPRSTSNIVNGITKKISVYQNVFLSLPEDQQDKLNRFYFGNVNVLRNNNNTISSSLYSHPGVLENGTPIGKKGDDPFKPEYYTPNGDVFVKWVYTASIGVSSNYVKALENSGLKQIVNDNYDFLDPSSFKLGEVTAISKTDIFGDKSNENNNEFTLNGDQIIIRDSSGKKQNTNFENFSISDFRAAAGLNSSKKGTTPTPVTNYAVFNRDTTYQASQTSYKGNFVPGYGRVLSPNIPISAESEDPVLGSDIVDFNFTLHVPGTSPNRLIDFTAYIEDWSDGVKAEWNPIKYMGRAESFYKYGGFSRDASVTFLVPALSRRNLIANYKKLNALAWSVSPSYSDIGLMRGVITYFTMGDYFKKMPTIIKNVEFSQIADMGWDINRKVGGGVFSRSDVYYTGQLPKGIKVTVGFTPLHDYTPQVGSEYIGYSSTAPNIYIPNPKGGQSAITSDSILYENDRVPIPEPGSQLPPPTTFTPSAPTQTLQTLPLQPTQLAAIPDSRSELVFTPLSTLYSETQEDFGNTLEFGETQGPTIDSNLDRYNFGPTSNNLNDIVPPEIGLENPNFGSGPINTGFNF
jgi:hypothetical protein